MGNNLPRAVITGSGQKFELTEKFGTILAEFEKRETSFTINLIRNLTAGLFTCVILISGFRYIYGYIYFGLAAAVAWSRIGFITASVLFLIWTLLFVRRFFTSSVYIHTNGISLLKTGRKPITLNWHQIGGISFHQEESSILFLHFSKSHAVLNPNQGKSIKLNDFCVNANIPELITIIKAKLYPILEQELIKQFKSGQRLYFGKISISLTTCKIGDDEYPWNDIKQINILGGSLYLTLQPSSKLSKVKQDKLTIFIKHILNPELLLKIAQLTNILG